MKVGIIGRFQIKEILKVNDDKSINATIIKIPYANNEIYKVEEDTNSFIIDTNGKLEQGPVIKKGIILEMLCEEKGPLLSPYALMYENASGELKTKVVYLPDPNLALLR